VAQHTKPLAHGAPTASRGRVSGRMDTFTSQRREPSSMLQSPAPMCRSSRCSARTNSIASPADLMSGAVTISNSPMPMGTAQVCVVSGWGQWVGSADRARKGERLHSSHHLLHLRVLRTQKRIKGLGQQADHHHMKAVHLIAQPLSLSHSLPHTKTTVKRDPANSHLRSPAVKQLPMPLGYASHQHGGQPKRQN
jgi:hypothetical protein